MKITKKKIFFILAIFFIILVFLINHLISKTKYENILGIENIFNNDQRYAIKKYLFPYQLINQLEEKNFILNKKNIEFKTSLINSLANKELKFKESLSPIKIENIESINLSNNLKLYTYKLLDGFYLGISNVSPGSGYIDFHNDNLVILSSRGVLAFTSDLSLSKSFFQIKNNIDDFINYRQYENDDIGNRYSIKDILIHENKIYVSFTEEIKNDCWNTSLIFGDMNYKEIIFESLYSNKNCIIRTSTDVSDIIDNEFEPHQSGGRIIGFENDSILFTMGEYRNRFLAQDPNSDNGKILKINTITKESKIISMGHRNPQGLDLNIEKGFILQAEHGPAGGDEINLIYLDQIYNNDLPNFGWAISSAGDHYGGKVNSDNDWKYEKYPLHNSHSDFGFVEPLKSFVPSIGISEITKLKNDNYVVSSMKAKSLFFFDLNDDDKIISITKVEVFERIRDIKYHKNKLYLFLEDTASLGIIEIK